jgi:hypothetical protein
MQMNTQSICKKIGDSGCYFISLLKLVNADYAAIGLYQKAIAAQIIDEDCFVQDPAALLALAAGGTWNVRHEDADYQTKRNEWEILRFERKEATVTYAHFVVGDGFGRVAYDPLDDSHTVAEGQLVSKRIITRLA